MLRKLVLVEDIGHRMRRARKHRTAHARHSLQLCGYPLELHSNKNNLARIKSIQFQLHYFFTYTLHTHTK